MEVVFIVTPVFFFFIKYVLFTVSFVRKTGKIFLIFVFLNPIVGAENVFAQAVVDDGKRVGSGRILLSKYRTDQRTTL